MAFNKVEYDNQYTRENYDIIRAVLPKGTRIKVKDCAEKKGLSVSQLIVCALEECYKLDLSKNNKT